MTGHCGNPDSGGDLCVSCSDRRNWNGCGQPFPPEPEPAPDPIAAILAVECPLHATGRVGKGCFTVAATPASNPTLHERLFCAARILLALASPPRSRAR